jgi:3',5'-nucleoside bisphosphate phosphatase
MNQPGPSAAKAKDNEIRYALRIQIKHLLEQGGCDFHLHTTASDGSDTPDYMVKRVCRSRLKAFSITDHDTMASIPEAQKTLEALQKTKPKQMMPLFIPGVELSVDLEGQEVHLLGYFKAGCSRLLEPFLEEQRLLRRDRNRRLIQRLQELGYAIDFESFKKTGDGAIGRVQAALLLKEKGYVQNISEAFKTLLGEGKPAYVPRSRPSLHQAITEIHKAGGLAVLAHPALYGWCEGKSIVSHRLLSQLSQATAMGLDGVEAYHGETSSRKHHEIEAAGTALGLLLTAGSDDHGSNKNQPLLYTRHHCWPDRPITWVVGALCSTQDTAGTVRYLLGQREHSGRHAGLWELPGGKVEPGETGHAALTREIREELNVDATVQNLAYVLWYDYPTERVILSLYETVLQSEQWTSSVHDQLDWMTAQEALDHPLLPADVVFFQELVKKPG